MVVSKDVLIMSVSGILILSILCCIRRIEINDDDDDNSISELLV